MDIHTLLDLSVKQQASDLHLIPGLPPTLRLIGELAPLANQPILSADDTKMLIYSLLDETQKALLEKELVIDQAFNLGSIGCFRASLFHQANGLSAVFRVIPKQIQNIDDLLLPPVLKSLSILTQGLIILTGPTGSGKSTTLAALIDYINGILARHIITIEDPIEFIYHPKKSIFNQMQVKRDTPDFATALRSSLRQDPDVILVGEMRDLETIRLALTAAETGHLVLSTLHAASAAQAISRMVDVFPGEEKNRIRNLLAESFQAIIYQTLLKKNGGGRIAAFEVLLPSVAIRNYVRQDMVAHIESAMQMGAAKGMCTLGQYLDTLVDRNLITKNVAHQAMAVRGEGGNISDPK